MHRFVDGLLPGEDAHPRGVPVCRALQQQQRRAKHLPVVVSLEGSNTHLEMWQGMRWGPCQQAAARTCPHGLYNDGL